MARSYPGQEVCPVARALGVIGDRWTILVLRDLLGGRTRYVDLAASLHGISPNLLSDRLQRLEAEGIVTRSMYSEHPPRAEYLLTPKGRALGPLLEGLRRWGRRYT